MKQLSSMNYRVIGGKPLSGEVTTNVSKNAAAALLAASLLNKGKTTLKRMPHIEEVNRLIEVLKSIGVSVEWQNGDVVIVPPEKLDISKVDKTAAEKTRSIALFLAPLAHLMNSFDLPAPQGCNLGKRSLPDILNIQSHPAYKLVDVYHISCLHASAGQHGAQLLSKDLLCIIAQDQRCGKKIRSMPWKKERQLLAVNTLCNRACFSF